MKRRPAFREGDLLFRFRGHAERLDLQGVPLPQGMSFVDFVVEEDARLLLVEAKDPSDPTIPPGRRQDEQQAFRAKLLGDTLINQELVPKARDSYSFLHLMARDDRPFIYVVVLGLKAYPDEQALLVGFKDRLLRRLRQEADRPWTRHYVADCLVLTPESWPQAFTRHRLSRSSNAASHNT